MQQSTFTLLLGIQIIHIPWCRVEMTCILRRNFCSSTRAKALVEGKNFTPRVPKITIFVWRGCKQVNNFRNEPTSAPVQCLASSEPEGVSSPRSIALGYHHFCVRSIKSGQYCWETLSSSENHEKYNVDQFVDKSAQQDPLAYQKTQHFSRCQKAAD